MNLPCLLCKNKISESVCVDCSSNISQKILGEFYCCPVTWSGTPSFLITKSRRFCAALDVYDPNSHRTSVKFRNSERSCEWSTTVTCHPLERSSILSPAITYVPLCPQRKSCGPVALESLPVLSFCLSFGNVGIVVRLIQYRLATLLFKRFCKIAKSDW